jgi:hypothetical protein
MKIKELNINDRPLIVLDDFYSNLADKELLYMGVSTLPFKIEGKNNDDIHFRPTLRLTSDLGSEFCNKINLFNQERSTILEKYIPKEQYTLVRAYCNLGTISDYQEIHVDSNSNKESRTLLIYCNKIWENNWGGETFFYSDDLEEVQFVSKNIPGRAIIFDGRIPHLAKIQHSFAQTYRFTIAIKFIQN